MITLKSLTSIISYPIFIKIPANTASGISATKPDSLNNRNISINGLIIAVNLVVEPVLIAATVLIVAAEPGSEPVKPQIIFPIPCPNSILFDEVLVFKSESETRTVNKLSDDKTIASITA